MLGYLDKLHESYIAKSLYICSQCQGVCPYYSDVGVNSLLSFMDVPIGGYCKLALWRLPIDKGGALPGQTVCCQNTHLVLTLPRIKHRGF